MYVGCSAPAWYASWAAGLRVRNGHLGGALPPPLGGGVSRVPGGIPASSSRLLATLPALPACVARELLRFPRFPQAGHGLLYASYTARAPDGLRPAARDRLQDRLLAAGYGAGCSRRAARGGLRGRLLGAGCPRRATGPAARGGLPAAGCRLPAAFWGRAAGCAAAGRAVMAPR